VARRSLAAAAAEVAEREEEEARRTAWTAAARRRWPGRKVKLTAGLAHETLGQLPSFKNLIGIVGKTAGPARCEFRAGPGVNFTCESSAVRRPATATENACASLRSPQSSAGSTPAGRPGDPAGHPGSTPAPAPAGVAAHEQRHIDTKASECIVRSQRRGAATVYLRLRYTTSTYVY
jgi:hypothetical protein